MAHDQEYDKQDARRAKTNKKGRGRRAEGAQYEFDQTSWTAVLALVLTAMAAGGAVRVGRTRDGGALALGMYVGDDYGTEYIRPSENADVAVQEIVDAWLPTHGKTYDRQLAELRK